MAYSSEEALTVALSNTTISHDVVTTGNPLVGGPGSLATQVVSPRLHRNSARTDRIRTCARAPLGAPLYH